MIFIFCNLSNFGIKYFSFYCEKELSSNTESQNLYYIYNSYDMSIKYSVISGYKKRPRLASEGDSFSTIPRERTSDENMSKLRDPVSPQTLDTDGLKFTDVPSPVYIPKKKRIENNYLDILRAIGEDSNREGLRNTPSRAAEAILHFTKGYRDNVDGKFFSFFNQFCLT